MLQGVNGMDAMRGVLEISVLLIVCLGNNGG